jgi:four helix bundle protein
MHYRESILWSKAMRLAEVACSEASRLTVRERFGIRSQMTRAAVSVVSNIAEGWNRESSKKKAQFFAIAQGSLAEVHTQFSLCANLGWLESNRLAELFGLVDEVGRMLTTLRQKLRHRHTTNS